MLLTLKCVCACPPHYLKMGWMLTDSYCNIIWGRDYQKNDAQQLCSFFKTLIIIFILNHFFTWMEKEYVCAGGRMEWWLMTDTESSCFWSIILKNILRMKLSRMSINTWRKHSVSIPSHLIGSCSLMHDHFAHGHFVLSQSPEP